MRPLKQIAFVALLIAVVGLAVTGYAVWAGVLVATDTRPPAVHAPDTVDVGPRESGTIVAAEFVVQNTGGGMLELSGFRSNCGCNSVEVRRDVAFFAARTVTVPAGEAATFRLVQQVRGAFGEPVRTPVFIYTNDPDTPEVCVIVSIPAVAGGVSADPPHLPAGEVQTGQVVVRTVTVRDVQRKRRVTGVTSSDPGRWAVRLLEPAGDNAGDAIARIEARLTATAPGPIDAEVRHTVDDPHITPEPIRVTGRLSRPVECSPPAVGLPRQSSAGPVYSMSVLCRSTTGTAFTLTPGTLPAGWSLSVQDAEPRPVHIVTVTLDPKHNPADRSAVLRLTAVAGGGTVPVVLPVTAGD